MCDHREPGRVRSSLGEAADHSMSCLETDTVRFIIVSQEKELEEAVSDPQRRIGLKAMIPGIKHGDYESVLSGVCGMTSKLYWRVLASVGKM